MNALSPNLITHQEACRTARCPMSFTLLCQGTACMAWRSVDLVGCPADPLDVLGYCGLGGIPHDLILPNPPTQKGVPHEPC